jgi:hypothetical protein
MMMGLADRVEAWARRLGIPPPPGVEVGAEAEVATAPVRAADGTSSGEADESEERFARGAKRAD